MYIKHENIFILIKTMFIMKNQEILIKIKFKNS